MKNLYLGDCIDIMSKIPDNSIDCVITDPPYGVTLNKWDSIIDIELMWLHLKRITKENSAICLFGQNKFSASLIMSNPNMYKYSWVWIKDNVTGFLHAKMYPLRIHEDILVFCKKPHKYNPQFTKGVPYKTTSNRGGENYGKLKPCLTENEGNRYPITTLYFSRDKSKVHPTQKPVALLEYLVKTYTNEGDTVLDFTMGSGSTGVACKNLNRDFIGIEKNDEYYDIAKNRIESAENPLKTLEQNTPYTTMALPF